MQYYCMNELYIVSNDGGGTATTDDPHGKGPWLLPSNGIYLWIYVTLVTDSHC